MSAVQNQGASARYPRDIAIRVLTRVLSDKQPLDEALAQIQGELRSDIAVEARAWLQEVCSGTLRWKGRLDFIIDSNALKKKPSGWLRKALLVASYQLVVQERAQPSRVVSETVAEVKKREGEAPAKFANALLRKVADHAESWRNLELPPNAPLEQAAAWASLPPWLFGKLEKDHGREWVLQYAQASLERPVLWVRYKSEHAAEAARLELNAGPVPESYRVDANASLGPIDRWDGFKEGHFFVQDISSQVLIYEVSQAVKKRISQTEATALDLCAAPGGKSVGLAWSGFRVMSSDRDERRLKLLEDTVTRVAPSLAKVVRKAEIGSLPSQDLVWVDAPCSGSGILRRHPDVRWLRDPREIARLNEVQLEVLKEGWNKVKSGGFLAFSVCSVLKEEGPELIARAELGAEKIGEWFLSPQTEPNGDGFWCVLLQKV